MDYNEEIDSLMEDAEQYNERDHRKTAIIEKAVRIADNNHDLIQQFDLRMDLLESAVASGKIEKALVAYGFILGLIDQYPEQFDFDYYVAWRYKWIIPKLPQFTHLSKERILAVLDDMEKRYKENNLSEKVVFYYRYRAACLMGEMELAQFYYDEQRKNLSGDFEMDCSACVANDEVDFFIKKKENAQAIKIAEPILKKEMSCTSDVPQNTLSALIPVFIEEGDLEKAREIADWLESIIKYESGFSGRYSPIILLEIIEKKYSQSLNKLESLLVFFMDSFNEIEIHEFYLVMNLLFNKISENESEVKLNLPQEFSLYQSNNTYVVIELKKWFEVEMKKISDKLNKRNGNDFFMIKEKEYSLLVTTSV